MKLTVGWWRARNGSKWHVDYVNQYWCLGHSSCETFCGKFGLGGDYLPGSPDWDLVEPWTEPKLRPWKPEEVPPFAGGPAFPFVTRCPDGGVSDFSPGMDLRDWFASHETLSEWDSQDSVAKISMCEALAGPMPVVGSLPGTQEEWIDLLNWEATWRAKLKYIRADAMLKAREQ